VARSIAYGAGVDTLNLAKAILRDRATAPSGVTAGGADRRSGEYESLATALSLPVSTHPSEWADHHRAVGGTPDERGKLMASSQAQSLTAICPFERQRMVLSWLVFKARTLPSNGPGSITS
jgi:hypothetical protein